MQYLRYKRPCTSRVGALPCEVGSRLEFYRDSSMENGPKHRHLSRENKKTIAVLVEPDIHAAFAEAARSRGTTIGRMAIAALMSSLDDLNALPPMSEEKRRRITAP